jgi:hypothetical protein
VAPTLAGDNACHRNPRNLYELKTNVSSIIADISSMSLQTASADLRRRVPLCMQHAGARFQNFL